MSECGLGATSDSVVVARHLWDATAHELHERRDQCDTLITALRECVVALGDSYRAIHWYDWHKCDDHDAMEYKTFVKVETTLQHAKSTLERYGEK